MQVRGRYLVAGWMAVFLAATSAILWRDQRAFEMARELTLTKGRIKSYEAVRTSLLGDIALNSSRAVLGPIAEAAGLHYVPDADNIQIVVPGPH